MKEKHCDKCQYKTEEGVAITGCAYCGCHNKQKIEECKHSEMGIVKGFKNSIHGVCKKCMVVTSHLSKPHVGACCEECSIINDGGVIKRTLTCLHSPCPCHLPPDFGKVKMNGDEPLEIWDHELYVRGVKRGRQEERTRILEEIDRMRGGKIHEEAEFMLLELKDFINKEK